MARKGDRALYTLGLAAVLLCVCVQEGGAQVNSTYTLGFLAPSEDSSIPYSLVTEWNSAFTVAMEILNSENRSYQLVPSVANTECDWQRGQLAAENIVRPVVPPLIGAVGPACSDAAMSVARVFMDYNYPLISFAATTELLSSRSSFPTFFRTVFSDSHQAMAVAATVAKLGMKKVTLLYTQQYYSMNLATNIAQAVSPLATVQQYQLQYGDNATVNRTQLGEILDTVASDEFVILAVQPLQAYDIWTAAHNMNKISFPYWYFGTDGVTAFDPVDTNVTDPKLVEALQGEIGLSPGGDISNNTHCEKFYSYWKAKNYPGFPSEGKNRTRSYVPHLIDAVHTYFVVIDNLIRAKVPVTVHNILLALNGSGPAVPQFQGCSGAVAFDSATGGRSTAVQVPLFDLVSLTPEYWEVKGQIENATFLDLLGLTRPEGPGSTNVGPNANGLSHWAKVGIIVGSLLAVVAVLALVAGGTYLYRRRGGRAVGRTESMARIIENVQK